MAPYNGHRSWNAWNVSLWIGGNERLYNYALERIRQCKTLRGATKRFMQLVDGKTPGGAVYNYTCVYEALARLKED